MLSVEFRDELNGKCTVSSLSRRNLLQMSAGFAIAGAITAPASASSGWQPIVERRAHPMPVEKPQRLYIKNQRTGDVFNDVVKQGLLTFEDAYAEIDHLMRDWRRDEVMQIDRGLIDLLLAVQNEVGHSEPITVISGYRSRSTNEMLRRKIRKVAKNSYHMRGMAVDLRIKGITTNTLRHVAMRQNAGGVGYYPSGRFIHIDTGPIRSWRS